MFNFTNTHPQYTHTHRERETSAHICCVLLLLPCLVLPSRSRREWTRISLSIFKLLPTLRRSLALAPLEQLLQHSGQTGERSTSAMAQQLHSYSTLSLSLSLPTPSPALGPASPLSVGMLTMIMKPASGRAARVAKQQVGPHSALPCPGLPACPFPSLPPLATLPHRYTERHSMQLFLGLFALRFRFRFWFRFRFPFLCRCDKTREISIICALTFSSSIPCSLSFALALSACHFCALSRSCSFVV